jgi:hypothetical protein
MEIMFAGKLQKKNLIFFESFTITSSIIQLNTNIETYFNNVK